MIHDGKGHVLSMWNPDEGGYRPWLHSLSYRELVEEATRLLDGWLHDEYGGWADRERLTIAFVEEMGRDDMSDRAKVEQLWDRVFELAEDEETHGKLTYDTEGTESGGVTITLDGKRWGVDIYPAEEA